MGEIIKFVPLYERTYYEENIKVLIDVVTYLNKTILYKRNQHISITDRYKSRGNKKTIILHLKYSITSTILDEYKFIKDDGEFTDDKLTFPELLYMVERHFGM